MRAIGAMWEIVGVGVLAYLLGSIPSGVIVTRACAGVDVRAVGSGHTGALNTYRATGLAPAVLTLLADGAKGVLAVIAAQMWANDAWGIATAAMLVVIGHCFPVWARFRGGMGLATGGGVFFALQPLVLIALILIWFPLKRILRAAPFASVAVAVLLPFLLLTARAETSTLAAGVGVGAIVAARHWQIMNSKIGASGD